MTLTRKKPLAALLQQAAHGNLKRTLTARSLVALGVGAIIGVGLFVRTAAASAQNAGPAVTLSFVIAAVGCVFAGLCYAEFAAMIPIADSAYTYAYTTMGELIAWIIGWALVLEYALGAATVAIGWSEYLNKLVHGNIPYQWCHSPLQMSDSGVQGIFNVPAFFIVLVLTLILIKGTQESAAVNSIIVLLKVTIVIVFVAVGWQFVNPGRDMPRGILGSLALCTVLYILFGYVLTGVCNWKEFQTVGKEASVAYAVQQYMHGYEWLATAIIVAILLGFSSVILVMLLG